MKTNVLCIPLLVSMTIALVKADNDNKGPRGVAPSRAKLYLADSAGHWACLDGSKTIPFNAINDDYCDCLDGSDEPGTSACGNTYFYCENQGHLPAYLKTSRVNDGVCDPECCDGSDEYNGIMECPNICERVGAEAKIERARIRTIEKEGSKIKKQYIAHGKNLKKQLQDQLDKLNERATVAKNLLAATQAALNEANEKRKQYLESTRAEREAAREIQLKPLIIKQLERFTKATEIKDKFHSTLHELKETYNKNYHDLAVKSTITEFEEYLEELKQEAIDLVDQQSKEDDKEHSADQRFNTAQDKTYDVKKAIGRMYQLVKTMKEKYNKEYNDEAVMKAISVLDEFTPSWHHEQNEFVGEDAIEIPAQVIDIPKSPDLELAQEANEKAEESEKKLTDEIADISRKFSTDYGKDEAFSKLVDQCFEFKEPEYTYTLCMFGEATQKSHSATSLGKFSSWVGDDYDTQLYTGGVRCWNGPERSVKVIMSCGAINEIVSVTEPAKCEYLLKFRTPAVCRIVDKSEAPRDDDFIPEIPMPSPVSPREEKKHDEL
ncbi:hypothetical protein BGZ76_009523 [Entomortierella beljakovae]|nr:hypothetical protein BGZ76_009523 [Entomortierella beljakovae]